MVISAWLSLLVKYTSSRWTETHETNYEFEDQASGATLHYVVASFVLFHSARPLKSLLYCR